jgi:hypothetical protein
VTAIDPDTGKPRWTADLGSRTEFIELLIAQPRGRSTSVSQTSAASKVHS